MGSIYKITNTVNGKSYIGQTIYDAEKTRIRDHLTGKGNQLIKNAIEKYGKDAFTYEILYDGIIPEFLDMLEIEAIAKHNCVRPNGFNLTEGGEGGSPSQETRRKLSESKKGEKHNNYGKKPSEETCRRISEANTGQKRSEETCRRISESKKGEKHPNYGKTLPEETKQKMSETKKGENNPNYGNTLSEEHRQKISKAITGQKRSEETCRRMSEALKRFYLSEKSEETCRKISEAIRSPYYTPAYQSFCTLSKTLTLREIRKKLREQFPNVSRTSIYEWTKKWQSEN